MPLLGRIVPNPVSRKYDKVQPVFSLGGTARRYLDSTTVAGETENTAPEQIRDPRVLTRGRALSFAHLGHYVPPPVYWMDPWTPELWPLGLKSRTVLVLRVEIILSPKQVLRKSALLFLFFSRFRALHGLGFSRFLAAFCLASRAAFFLRFFSARRFCRRFFLQILHNQGNPPV
jgi:hypothetical protein